MSKRKRENTTEPEPEFEKDSSSGEDRDVIFAPGANKWNVKKFRQFRPSICPNRFG